MKPILSFIKKETLLLLRDPAGLLMLFVLPAIFIFILSIALQGTFSSPNTKNKLKMLVVNSDAGDFGKTLIQGLTDTGYFQIDEQYNGKKITLKEAKTLLDKKKYKLCINIPHNATNSVNFNGDATIDLYIDPVLSNDFVTNVTNTIQNFVNLSIIQNISTISNTVFNKIKKNRLTKLDEQLRQARKKRQEIMNQYNELTQTQMDEDTSQFVTELTQSNIKELDATIKDLLNQKKSIDKESPINIATKDNSDNIHGGLRVSHIYVSKSLDTTHIPTSVEQNVPGWTIFALFWIVQILAINILLERKSGVFKRFLISPMHAWQYIIGKIIPFFLLNMLQAVIMFAIGVFILPYFGCEPLQITNIGALIVVTAAISFTAITLGFMIGIMSKTFVLAASLSAVFLILMAVIGGIMVPRFIMPIAMQKLGLIVPHGWALDAYLNILVRGYNFKAVLPQIGGLVAFGFLFLSISVFHLTKRITTSN